MPKYVVQPGVRFFHDGKEVAPGGQVELTADAAEKKIARGDLKLAGGGKPMVPPKGAGADKPPQE